MKETIKNIIYLARRFKLATTLNLAGLIVAFTAFYLLMTQVIYQRTFNHGIENLELLYRMESNNVYKEDWKFSNLVCRPFAEALQLMPEVDCYSLIYDQGFDNYSRRKFYKFEESKTDTLSYLMYPSNKTVVSTLTSKVLDGKIEWSDDDLDGVIIPERIAMEYFGTVKAAGMKLWDDYAREKIPFIVRGVYQDFPKNCELTNDIYYYYYGPEESLMVNSAYRCIVKFKTIPDDMNAFMRDLKKVAIDHLREGLTANGVNEQHKASILKEAELTDIKLTPLSESYFEHSSFTTGERGYRGLRDILALTCLLVLVIAAINFLNFSLAESPMRVRGLNTRLVLGASKRSLKLGIVAEGIIISLIACIFALIVCHLLQGLPVMQKLTQDSLALENHGLLIVAMIIIAIIVGIIASIYPGNFATSFPPAMALKGSFGLTPQGKNLRKVLIGMQLCISMLMIIYIGMLYRQGQFIFNSEYGYDCDQILLSELPLPDDDSYNFSKDNDTLYQAIIKIPGVEDVAFSETKLGLVEGQNGVVWDTHNDTTFNYSIMHCSRNFLSTMGIHVSEGRDFNDEDTMAVVINQAARDQWNWHHLGSMIPTVSSYEEPNSAPIVGVCDNIRYSTVRINNSRPFAFVFQKDYDLLGNLIVRLTPDADKDAVKQQINEILKKKYHSGNQHVDKFKDLLVHTYENEFRYSNLMVIICFICLIITLIGVFCLTLFDTEYRRKEIGIRKISGATTGEIIWLLCKQYIRHLLIAFAFATPLAIVFVWVTFNYFKQHATINWWLFPLALLLVGGVTLGIVVLQSLRAARENPANSIRKE